MTANPYLEGLYAPVADEIDIEVFAAEGAIPRDLAGLYVRNGPNPRHAPGPRHHWFDGDGMLHAIAFQDERAHYRNRYVRTPDFDEESAAGRPLYGGILAAGERRRPAKPCKDTANTDVLCHGGRLLALWYVSGAPIRVDPANLETLGVEDLWGRLPRTVSAHSKCDPATGELIFFDYASAKPWLGYGVASAAGELLLHVAIDLPGPRLPHDLGASANYSVVMDLPFFSPPESRAAGTWQVRFHPDLPARFGVLPRRGAASELRWFEAEPCYVYHLINVYEQGDELVMDGYRTAPGYPEIRARDGALGHQLAYLRLRASAYRWCLDLATGATREGPLDDRIAEFPSINAHACLGRPNRYSYALTIPDTPTLHFDGIVKHDWRTGDVIRHGFEPGWSGSEASFAPRDDAKSEDDGYLHSFAQHAGTGDSAVLVFDAQALAEGPVARIPLPQRVPAGFHACWVAACELADAWA